jgi:hypothetical protein
MLRTMKIATADLGRVMASALLPTVAGLIRARQDAGTDRQDSVSGPS